MGTGVENGDRQIPLVLHLHRGKPGRLAGLGRDEQGRVHWRLELPRPLPVAARMVAGWAQILAPGRVTVLFPDGRPVPCRGSGQSGACRETGEARAAGLTPSRNGSRRVLYHCFGGAHTSLVAASLHLGRVPERPTWREIASLPHFDCPTTGERGWPLLLGRDSEGREVYAMGRGRDGKGMMRALASLLWVLGVNPQELATYDTLSCACLLTKFGGYLSRRLGLVRPGRRLVAMGVWRDLPRLRRVVERAWEELGATAIQHAPGIPG